MTKREFEIGQKVMVIEPVKEADKFKVGTVIGFHDRSNNYYVRFDKEEYTQGWHASRLELLPEILQGKTQEEAERAVKSVAKVAEALEPFKDKRIAELEKQVEDLKRELVQRPIVILPKEAVVNIRVGKAMEEYKPLNAEIKPQTAEK